MRMMEWDDVRVLLMLLNSRTLGEAGKRLGVDRSTIGRRVAALENSTGARLFVRTREGLRPTATAERLRPHAEAMERQAIALAHAARADEGAVSGTVRVATTEALAAFLVAEGLLEVRAQYPELVIEIAGGNRPVDLARGEADIAVRMSTIRGADLRVRCVARMSLSLFAAPSYLRARGTPRNLKGLRGHDVVLQSGELAAMPEAKWLAARDDLRVVFRSSSMAALVAAAVAGYGLIALTTPWGARESGLEPVLLLDDLPRRPVWLVTHASARDRSGLRAVCDRIAGVFGRALTA